jgi:FixJ family two-component response regulator
MRPVTFNRLECGPANPQLRPDITFTRDANRSVRTGPSRDVVNTRTSTTLSIRSSSSRWPAFSPLQTDIPECLIVDLQMPDMNGVELEEHLVRSGIIIPTILITAHADAVSHSDDGRFAARLRKPIQEETLFDAIDRAVGGSRGG